MATTSTLVLFNDVLREIGSHPLANLTTTNTRLQELNGALPHAVEYMLSRVDWNFARRRSTLTGVADTSHPPYTYRYARPSDYLRKVWVKADADDEFQIPHTETGAVIYGFETSAKIDYISDHSDNYDPVNWPPQFTRCMVLYLVLLVGPKLARAGDGDAKAIYQKLDIALADAERVEAVYAINSQLATNRLPVMRRALELIGQQMAGTAALNNHIDRLRWSMNNSWDHTIKYVLEQGAWNFATKRALFTSGVDADSEMPTTGVSGIVEGYSVGPAEAAADAAEVAGYEYGFPLPDDFLHKIWLRGDVRSDVECRHQIVANYVFVDYDPAVMEYVALSDFSIDPDNWPATFMDAVAARLALAVSPELEIADGGKAIKANSVRDKLETLYARALSIAKSKDAIQQYPASIPIGSFARARLGTFNTRSTMRLR